MGLRWVRAVVVVLALALGASAWAAPKGTGTEAIRGGNDKLRELLAKNADANTKEMGRELKDLFDIPFLAQRALADHWEKMTAQQRTDLSTTLQAIIEKNYLSQLKGNLDYRIEYVAEDPKGEDVLVKTLIHAQNKGRPSKISVDYRLRPEGDHWRVYDVITEEVSILQNYRQQFNKIIAKDGVDGLLAKMKTKLEKGQAAKDEKEPRPAKGDK